MESIKCLEENETPLCVIALPEEFLQDAEVVDAFAIPVMKRTDGLMVALPAGYLRESLLRTSDNANFGDLVGPCLAVNVPAVEEETNGTESHLGIDLPCVIVDFNAQITMFLRDFLAGESPPNLPFCVDNPHALPSSSGLLFTALGWVGGEKTEGSLPERMQYYSAEEELAPENPVTVAPKPKPAPKAKAAQPKRVTTAALADQVATLVQALPSLSSQIQDLQSQQGAMQQSLQAFQTPPHRQSFPVMIRMF